MLNLIVIKSTDPNLLEMTKQSVLKFLTLIQSKNITKNDVLLSTKLSNGLHKLCSMKESIAVQYSFEVNKNMNSLSEVF